VAAKASATASLITGSVMNVIGLTTDIIREPLTRAAKPMGSVVLVLVVVVRVCVVDEDVVVVEVVEDEVVEVVVVKVVVRVKERGA
jgi:hypothetical protein